MRFFLIIIFSLCVTQVISGALGQESSNPYPQSSGIGDPRKVDEIGNILWGDEKVRLDNVAAALKQESDTVVYLYVYAGRRGCVGEAQARAVRAKDYLVSKRGIEADRVIWKDGGHRENRMVEVWVWPRAAAAPDVSPTVDPSEARLKVCKARRRLKRGKS